MSKTYHNDDQLTPPLQETERDRWNFDQGYERGWDARLDPVGLTNLAEIREVLQAVIAGLDLQLEQIAAKAGKR